MNFLAHLHLADRTPSSRLGNLLGDFVRGRPDERFPPEIWAGIMQHRHLDAFTDSHPEWKKSKSRLSPGRLRFAGIIIDVFYDHFLANHWSRFAEPPETLEQFVDGCHNDLRAGGDLIPREIRVIFARMEQQQWLISYRTLDGIRDALDRTSLRSRNLGPIRGSVDELEDNYDLIERDFLSFYPDAMQRAAELRDPDSL